MAKDQAVDRTTLGTTSVIEPGIVSRVASGLRWMVSGKPPALVDQDSWFGPLNPLPPMAPDSVAGRQFDYPVGFNLVTQPRQAEPFSFRQLRALADSYDLLRLVIETRKDQIAGQHWLIQPKDPARGAAGDPRCKQVMDFLARPDREHGWDSWLRMVLEDVLVIDAATLYPRRTLGGQLYALEPIDGATIKRVIDPYGRTPLPPAPAYQQVLKGLPAVDYAAGDLFYLPRNPRTDRIYGFSPVEQIAMSVNIALRRQLHQLQYYTEGTVPDALIGVPETWSPDQIGQFQAYWDALLEGDTATRRHTRFVPATISKSFVQTKDAALKDEYDEWLARIVCYAFSVSPQWAVQQMNRATADSAREQASEEGLEPLMRWVKGMIDTILAQAWQWPDLEFCWREDKESDGLTQAQISQTYLAAGVLSINEVRAAQGLDPVQGGEEPTVAANGSIIRLSEAVKSAPASDPRPDDEPPPKGGRPKLGKSYNPDQPRDTNGRWSDGGGSDASANASTADKPIQLTDSGSIATDAPTRPATSDSIQVASNDGPYKPLGSTITPAPDPDPLDPQKLNTAPPSPPDEQAIADTMNKIANGDPAEIAALKPHPYTNYPHPATGAVLPFSSAGYTAFDVPIGKGVGQRGDGRLIVDNGGGTAYYTGNHYKSFYPCNFPPIPLNIPR